ncbi:MAG: sigma-70 family RNA polymerase sigma factor [Aliishimia sp.]
MKNRKMHLCRALKVVGSIAAAEDVIQNTALKCLSSAELDKPERLQGYVTKMVKNTALDYLRKNTREVAEPFDDAHKIALAGTDDRCGFRHWEKREELKQVVRKIASFPKHKQNAFIRHRLGGVPQKQIAQDLDVSPTLVNFMIKDIERACRTAGNDTVSEQI